MMPAMFRLRKTPPPPPSEHVFDGGTERFTFLWIRGTGRRFRIEVAGDGAVRVHAPAGASFGQARAFVAEKAAWILRTREKLRFRTRLIWPAAPRAGDEFFWAGRRLRVEEFSGRRLSIRLDPDRLVIVRPPSADADRTARRAGRRLRIEAERLLGGRLALCLPSAARFGMDFAPPLPRVSYRMMKRRWGSCGRDGRIVLNLRLAQLPDACVDYVILHELCHLRHHHHGRAFYLLLARVCLDWQERKQSVERFIPAS